MDQTKNALAGDDRLPELPDRLHHGGAGREERRLLCKTPEQYAVQYMPPDLLQRIDAVTPQVSGIALVTAIGPLLPKGNGGRSREREVRKA